MSQPTSATESNTVLKEFTNELDHEIRIQVNSIEDADCSVRVMMEGPDSIAENFITRQEAEQLHAALQEFLDKLESQ